MKKIITALLLTASLASPIVAQAQAAGAAGAAGGAEAAGSAGGERQGLSRSRINRTTPDWANLRPAVVDAVSPSTLTSTLGAGATITTVGLLSIGVILSAVNSASNH
jgi:hypothetical protein